MRCQELDQPANAGLAAEALAHLARLLFRNPRNLRQPFGLIFQHVEAGRAKTRNNLLRRLRADALDRAGGKERKNLRLCLRHEPLEKLRLKLLAVVRMMSPPARNHQALAHDRHWDRPDHSHKLAVLRAEL